MDIRNMFPAYRVFVFGVDVTEDVLSVSFTHSDGRAPDTAQIVLANLDDKYIFTQEDLHCMYKDIPLDGSKETIAKIEQELVDANLDDALTKIGISEHGEFDTGDLGRAGAALEAGDALDTLIQRVKANLDDLGSSTKGRVLRAKIDVRQTITQPTLKDFSTGHTSPQEKLEALAGEACTYHFQVGDAIFHSNDPIRIFWRDPAVPTAWYYAFSGYVSDYIDHIGPDGETELTIQCEDVLRTLRYARIATNPSIFDIQAVLTDYDSAFLSFYQSLFANLTLTEAVALMLFGSTATKLDARLAPIGTKFTDKSTVIVPTASAGNRRISVNGSIDIQTEKQAVGSFNFDDSAIYIFGHADADIEEPKASGDIPHIKVDGLGQYSALTDTKVYVEDLYTLYDSRSDEAQQKAWDLIDSIQDSGTGQFLIEDVIRVIGENPHVFPVEGRLVALLPASLGQGLQRKIADKDVINSFAMVTKFTNRLQQIYDICQRIDFSFYTNGRGDLLLEMPLYDFHPRDFSSIPVVLPKEKLSPDRDIPIPLSHRGPYAQRMTVLRRSITSWDRSFSDEKIRTMFRVPYKLIENIAATGDSDDIGMHPEVVTLFSLIPQFGVRMEEAQPWGYMVTREAAAAYGLLQINKWNADARTLKLGMIMRMGLGPNRPLQVLMGSPTTGGALRRAYIGTIRNITYSIQWGSSVEMTVGLHQLRGWDGQLTQDGKDKLYAPIGGFASRPLNYALLFKPADFQRVQNTKPKTPMGAIADGNTRASEEDKINIDRLARDLQRSLLVMGIDAQLTSTYRSAQLQESLHSPAGQRSRHLDATAIDLQARPGTSTTNQQILNALVDSSKQRTTSQGYPAGVMGSGEVQGFLAKYGAFAQFETDRNHVHIEFDPSKKAELKKWLAENNIP